MSKSKYRTVHNIPNASKQTEPKPSKTLVIRVRFYVWNEDSDMDCSDFIECDEHDFEQAEGLIQYERHTVFENGVSQIILTKNPFGGC